MGFIGFIFRCKVTAIDNRVQGCEVILTRKVIYSVDIQSYFEKNLTWIIGRAQAFSLPPLSEKRQQEPGVVGVGFGGAGRKFPDYLFRLVMPENDLVPVFVLMIRQILRYKCPKTFFPVMVAFNLKKNLANTFVGKHGKHSIYIHRSNAVG